VLNGLNWASFEILSMGNREVEALPMGFRILDGLFQALGMWPLISSTGLTNIFDLQLSALAVSRLLRSPN
jgi:hypothetical protein